MVGRHAALNMIASVVKSKWPVAEVSPKIGPAALVAVTEPEWSKWRYCPPRLIFGISIPSDQTPASAARPPPPKRLVLTDPITGLDTVGSVPPLLYPAPPSTRRRTGKMGKPQGAGAEPSTGAAGGGADTWGASAGPVPPAAFGTG